MEMKLVYSNLIYIHPGILIFAIQQFGQFSLIYRNDIQFRF